jgi:Lon protease-like protein
MSELAMFPLGTVLLPSMAMPLHIFEPRYRVLARHLVDGGHDLGVVLIERGSEVGGGDVRARVGTRARVLQAVELEDGRWIVALVGVERVRILRWLPDDPFPRADVVDFPGQAAGQWATDRRHDLEQVLRRVLALQAELGVRAAPATVALDPDPELATWQAAALAPLGPFDAQRVLETVSADQRVALVMSLLEDEAVVLAQRVAGG